MTIIDFTANHVSLLLDKTGQHLLVAGAAVLIAAAIALPVGVLLGHLHRGGLVAVNVANALRAVPSLALISICIGVLGLGYKNILVALVVLAIPSMLVNSYVSVDTVEQDVVDAARGIGMSFWQIIRRVELPLALPLIVAGIRTSVVYTISAATLAGLAGGGGLGDIIVSQATYGLAGVVTASIWVAALALVADGLLALVHRRIAGSTASRV